MVRLLVTSLEMTAPPVGAPRAAPDPDALVRREVLTVAVYLALYRAVGAAVQWDERLRLEPGALALHLADPATSIFVLRLRHRAVGFCEAVRDAEGAIEIANFGLLPECQGRGLGPYLLEASLAALWTPETARIWLRTDTNDHPAAITVYEQAGFRRVGAAWMEFPD
jgi:thiosulfate/3-mercaptopyruvate sulfurtransferase